MRIYFAHGTHPGSYQFISLFFVGFVFIAVSKNAMNILPASSV